MADPLRRHCLCWRPFVFIAPALAGMIGCQTILLPDKVILPEEGVYSLVQFSYVPASVPSKADLTLALVSPTFRLAGSAESEAESFDAAKYLREERGFGTSGQVAKVVVEFFYSMEPDLEKTLAAVGFRTLGPFSERGEMTYPQREQSDLALEAKVIVDIHDDATDTERPLRRERNFQGRSGREEDETIYDYYQTEILPGTVRGKMYAGARIELYLFEPLSWEKMWVRTIGVKSSVTGSYSYRFNTKNGQTFVGEDNRPEVYGQVLTKLYAEVFSEFQKYFDPKEITALAEKAKEVRGKKRF